MDGITRTPAQDVIPPGCPVARVNPFAPDHMLDPFPYYQELQRDTPVAYVADHDFWMVTSHGLCLEVLRDPVAFRQWDGDELFQPGEGPPLVEGNGQIEGRLTAQGRQHGLVGQPVTRPEHAPDLPGRSRTHAHAAPDRRPDDGEN